jgi:pimeloyl-ACP methyl ester carboxylesterase
MIVIGLLILKSRPLPDYGETIPYKQNDLKLFGEDGTFLPGEMLVPERPSGRAVILVADKRLDRNWNTTRISFDTGKLIAHVLASNGAVVTVYDQRGAGLSVPSGKNYPNPSNSTSDLHTVYEKAKELAGPGITSMEIVAHGQGCLTALLAVNRYKLRVARIYLLGCAASGRYLEFWSRQILQNMERSGVEAEVMKRAESVVAQWLAKPEYEPILFSEELSEEEKARYEKIDKDLQPLYRGLDYMQSEEMIDWTRLTKEIAFDDEIRKALRSGVKIAHILTEFDEEIPARDIEHYTKKSDLFPEKNYSLRVLKGADHFFYLRKERAFSSFRLILDRAMPIKDIHPELFKNIIEP